MAGRRKVVLSGIKPTGPLHLGNLFGAVLNWVRLQEEYDCHYMVADLHALTGSPEGYKEIDGYRRRLLVNLVAFGIDPERSVLFVQSEVPEHARLHLLLSMLTPLPWLERNPTYKDQIVASGNRDYNNYGFLGYPVLQAADIMVYKAERVPVGEDQLPHLELTREIVRRFNHHFGPVFPEPEALLTPSPRIPGLDGRKMSKSFGNAIEVEDDAATVERKVMMAVTDPQKVRRGDPGRPEVCNCYALQKVFASPEELAEIEAGCRSGRLGCVECKRSLARRINAFLDPYRERRERILAEKGRLEEAVAEGNRKARARAAEVLEEAVAAMGIGYHGL